METKLRTSLLRTFGALLVLVCAVSAVAEEKKEKKLPKSGLLAVSSIAGAGRSITGDLFGGEDIFGDTLPPITGSLSRASEEKWRFSVSNNTQDTYSVNLDLIQKDESDRTVKFSSYSYTLKPGQQESDSATAGTSAMKAELHLRSYRNLTERKK
jgi:hypothetical protein